MSEWFIEYDRDIDEEGIRSLLGALRRGDSPKAVLVNSDGGSLTCFDELGPAIKNLEITTMAGDVASSAIVLYLLGRRRLATPRSSFYFHEIRAYPIYGPGQDVGITLGTFEEAIESVTPDRSAPLRVVTEQWLSEMKSVQTWFVNFISEQTGIPAGVFLRLMRDETVLRPWDALNLGIIHEIVD